MGRFGLIFSLFVHSVIGGLIRPELAGGLQIAPRSRHWVLLAPPTSHPERHSILRRRFQLYQAQLPTSRRRIAKHRFGGCAGGCVSALTGSWMTHFVLPDVRFRAPPIGGWVRMVLSTAMIGLIIWP
jgi:hypothetical protein